MTVNDTPKMDPEAQEISSTMASLSKLKSS